MTEGEGLNRNLIFIVVFLASFFVLIGLVSAGFIYAGKSYTQYEYPDFFEKADIENIRFYESKNITVGLGSWEGFDFSGQGADFVFRVYFQIEVLGQQRYLSVSHMNPYFFWFWMPEIMMFESSETYGTILDRPELITLLDTENNVSRISNVWCNHITINFWVRDSNSTRNDVIQAFDDGTVEVTLGFGYDSFEATMNAWDIAGRLLSFQAIETGITPVNILIAIPIWVSIAYLVFRLILFALPFVG